MTGHDLNASQADSSNIVDFSTELPPASGADEEHIPDPTIHASLSNPSFLHNVGVVGQWKQTTDNDRSTRRPPRLPYHTPSLLRPGIWQVNLTTPADC